jgi:hypothetical protein
MLFQSLVECAVMMPDLRKQWHYKENPKEGEVVLILWRNLRGYFASFGGWILLVRNASLVKRQYFI